MKSAISIAVALWLASPVRALDLTEAVVAPAPGLTKQEQKAVSLLVEEAARRSGVRWPVGAPAGGPAIHIRRGKAGGPAEGYRLTANAEGVIMEGSDARGVLFGVGRLLRTLRIGGGRITITDGLNIGTSPRYSLRGHQLGYRGIPNSYDGWTPAMFEQYIRDLAVFGTNAIEVTAPRTEELGTSPHFTLPKLDMIAEVSRICDAYGLDLWLWIPALDEDYGDPATVELALREWGEVFRALPRLDAVFVPAGDPGHTPARHLMPLLEKQAANLRRYHPKAQLWVAPQSFDQANMDEFLAALRAAPAWLAGVVYGPQTRGSIHDLRTAVPQRYPVRNYADTTHNSQAQHHVDDWDLAHAMTFGREGINPRPQEMRAIFRNQMPSAAGFLNYSEGCHDDVNKIVWSVLGWDPGADLTEALREYGRYFLGESLAEGFAQGLLALERNWQGPLAANRQVLTALAQFQELERAATPKQLLEFRFQMALYRAYYDAYNHRRLLHEMAAEEGAMSALRGAAAMGSRLAMERAAAVLNRAASQPPAGEWRARIFALAEALYQSIRLQLSVPRYQAFAQERGATLDNMDIPFNNRGWLLERFGEIRALPTEARRLEAIHRVVNWTDPGPGGFYDDLGDLARQPHLVRGASYADDPGHLRRPRVSYARRPWELANWRRSWISHVESLFDSPVEMYYPALDRSARYKLRVVYGGEAAPGRSIRCVANRRHEIHPYLKIEDRTAVREFPIPPEATAGGGLRLEWTRPPGLGGNGRGCQIAEVWLIRE